MAVIVLAVTGQATAAEYRGHRVSEVLDQLRSEGLTFIYNTDNIPDSLIIAAEPRAVSGTELASEILQPHGLVLSEVAPRMFAVVRAAAPARVPADKPTTGSTTPVEEVVVQTSRYALASDISGSHAFLDQVQVSHLPRLGDETLQAVQRLPGAAVNGFSSIGPIRGGVPNETAILLDGLRLYEPFHLKNYLSPVSLLDSRFVADLDVFFGGFPARFGDRMSAIIDARSIHPSLPRYYELGLSMFHASGLASLSFADDRARALVSARRSNLGELAQFAENEIGEPSYSDGFARLDYSFDDATRGSLSTLLSHDNVQAIRSSGTERAHDESDNAYLWATLEHDWSTQFDSRAILSWTSVSDERQGQVNDPGRRSGTVKDDRSFEVIGLRIDNEWEPDEVVAHRFGVEVRRLWASYDYEAHVDFAADFPFPGSPPSSLDRSVVLHPDGFEASGYWDTRLTPNRLWTLEGGLRVDTQTYDGSGDSAQWGPRLSVLYNAGTDTRLRASWGRFYQSQGIDELQVQDGVDHFYPAQHAVHSIFSVEHSFAYLDARVEIYRKDYRRVNPRFENLFDPLVLLPELQYDRVRIAPSSARADGMEVWLNFRPIGHWSGWLSYTWSQVQDRIDGQDVYRSWDQRHAVSLGIAWSSGPWSLTVADVFHSGWPTTQLSLSPSPTPGNPPVSVGARNALRYDDFNSLDVRLTRTFILPRGQLDVFAEVTNLLMRENPCCTQYDIVQSSAGDPILESNTDSWLPLVPSIGVLWRYGQTDR